MPGTGRSEPAVSFRVPSPAALPRGRVTDQLVDCRFGVVLAPPGFGKTVLLAHVARAHRGPVTWYQAGPGTGARDLLHNVAHGALGRPPTTDELASRDVLLAAVRGDGGTEERLLVVDELHLLDHDSRELVIRLGQLAPPHPRVLAGIRPARGLGPAELEHAGATVVDTDTLRFRSWEVERLFARLYEMPLRPDAVLPVTRATGGWAMALRLFARAGAGRPYADHRGFLADGMFGHEYLERQVLAPLPRALRRFLEDTSPLERLTVTSCQEVTGRQDTRETLRALTHDYGVLHADPDGRTYRCEALVRIYLRARLAERSERSGRPGHSERWGQDGPAEDSAPAAGTAAGGALTGRPGAASRRGTVGEERRRHDWAARLRAALASDLGAAGAALEPEPDAGELLVRALTAALRGDGTAGGVLRRCLAHAGDDLVVALSARLTRAALAVLAAGPAGCVPYQEIQRIAHDAERHGQHWLTRAARCLLGLGPHPEDAEQLSAARDECERWADQRGAAIAVAVDCLHSIRAGRPDLVRFEEAVGRFRALGWGVPEAWARAALAVIETSRDLPDAAERAAQSEAFTRSASAPGARAVALAAVALTKEDTAELLDVAWSVAESVGLPVATLRSWLAALGLAAQDRPGRGVVTAGPPALAIRCFGGFSLTLAGRELDWSSVRPKAQAVLRLLALRAGHPIHRDQMIAAFWADLGYDAAVHNMQVSVSSLRTFLEPGLPRGSSRLIVRHGESYQLLLPAGSSCDVAAFEQAVTDGRRARDRRQREPAITAFRAALGRYTGELLPEDGAAEWLATERDRFRRDAASAAIALAELELERGRPAEAVEAAMRGLEIDAFRDAAWRVLILGHERAGQAAVAARARKGYADMLASLGLDPTTHAGTSA